MVKMMRTKKFKQELFIEKAYCDCGGELICFKSLGTMSIKDGSKTYEHQCDTCLKYKTLDKRYPRSFYKEAEVNENLD